MKILVINAGSSSIKYQLYRMPEQEVLSKGALERIGESGSRIKNHRMGLSLILSQIGDIDSESGFRKKIKQRNSSGRIDAIGHRVVHGGEEFSKPTLITSKVVRRIKSLNELAPLHNPANLEGIYACQELLPDVRQVAVFDTAFHQTLPEYAYIYGLPFEYYRRFKVRKYGFHGMSHQYVASEAARILNEPLTKLKIITCHLGNGCSITAVKNGRSIDTSMGFTPLEGLLMGTRTGDMDPAVVTFLERKLRINSKKVDDILNKYSGLKGLSGISNDMRKIDNAASSGNRRARLAIDVFIYRIKKYIGAYTVLMGGVDALVFTGGIGQHSAKIRRQVTKGLFSSIKKQPRILVVPTNEELMIARQTYDLLRRQLKVKS